MVMEQLQNKKERLLIHYKGKKYWNNHKIYFHVQYLNLSWNSLGENSEIFLGSCDYFIMCHICCRQINQEPKML